MFRILFALMLAVLLLVQVTGDIQAQPTYKCDEIPPLEEIPAEFILREIADGKSVMLNEVVVSGNLDLGTVSNDNDVTISSSIVIQNSYIDGNITTGRKPIVFEQEFDLGQSTVGGGIRLSNAVFETEAYFELITVCGETTFAESQFRDITQFQEAVFHQQANFDGALFAGRSDFTGADFFNQDRPSNGVTVSDTLVFSGTLFQQSQDSQGMGFTNSTFMGTVSYNGAKFNGSYSLTNSIFQSTVTFVDADVRSGILNLEGSNFIELDITPIDAHASSINIRNIRFESLLFFRHNRPMLIEPENPIERIKLYRNLESALVQQQIPGLALVNDILFDRRVAECEIAGTRTWEYIVNCWMEQHFLGFRVRPARILFWSVVCVLIGMVVFRSAGAFKVDPPPQNATPTDEREIKATWGGALSLSFGAFTSLNYNKILHSTTIAANKGWRKVLTGVTSFLLYIIGLYLVFALTESIANTTPIINDLFSRIITLLGT